VTEPISEEILIKKIADVHVIGLNPRTPISLSEEILRAGHRLLAVACFGMQTQYVDLKICNDMGIAIFNSPYGDSISLAEMVIGLLIGMARELGERNNELHRGIWKKKSLGCHELRGKTLGIVGYGNIGSLVGVLAEGIGMRVIWYDEKPLVPIGLSESRNTMEEVLCEADFVTLHVMESLNISSPWIQAKHFAMMKKGAYFINSSWGCAVDLSALIDALKSGHLAGAAIDVFPDEPIDPYQKSWMCDLKSCSNMILTPHIGNSTIESKKRVGIEVASHIIRYIREGCTVGCVNFPTIDTVSVKPNSRRIINIHKNVRGVVQEIDFIVSHVNIGKQVIETSGNIGYIIIDIDTKEVTADIVASLAAMGNTIRTRIV
jgi:D-3-phosphoglycerate dehydrogenase